jgi:hypothetical protein
MTYPKATLSSAAETFTWLHTFPGRHGRLARIALYLFVVLIACPIRYWPLGDSPEDSWRFALNYAPAHGLAVGRDVIFTCGPLVYLLFPLHLGSNLTQGLLFQTSLWLSLAAILADVFFRTRFPLRNLALFSFLFSLAAPLFWFNSLGTENLMLAGALILILIFHLRGSLTRYVPALILVGLLPLFKLTAGMVGFTALAGFQIERVIRRRWKALPEAALSALIPIAVTAVACLCVMPSASSILRYLRGSAEITSGFSAAMSVGGPHIELVSALEAIALLVILLCLHATEFPGLAKFYAWLIALPLFVSLKHGFVRQDEHIVNFFCFAALTLALVSLTVSLHGKNVWRVASLAALFFVIWQDNVGRLGGMAAVTESTGVRAARMLWGALRFDRLPQKLDATIEAFPRDLRIEAELMKLIGNSSIAPLSFNYTNLAAAHLQVRLYPVVERYSAYTPYLDGLNADWIRDKGPRFLVFDGKAIDGRDPWAETPAMWLEIYRWYDARLLGSRNLLLERRAGPRFTTLETIGRFRIAFPGEFRLPVSSDPVFWTMNCGQSIRGRFRRLLFRLKSVDGIIHETGGVTRWARVIPDVLVSPVLGNYWPDTLSQFAAVFHPSVNPTYSVDRVAFEVPGSASYSSGCQVEILRPMR